MSDLFFALSRQGRGMADKNRRIPVNRAALPRTGKICPLPASEKKPGRVSGGVSPMRPQGSQVTNPPLLPGGCYNFVETYKIMQKIIFKIRNNMYFWKVTGRNVPRTGRYDVDKNEIFC